MIQTKIDFGLQKQFKQVFVCAKKRKKKTTEFLQLFGLFEVRCDRVDIAGRVCADEREKKENYSNSGTDILTAIFKEAHRFHWS